MRVLILDSDSERTKHLSSRMPVGVDVIVYAEQEAFFKDLEENESESVVILDMDALGNNLSKVNERLLINFAEAKRFFVTEKLGPNDLREHQQSPDGADGYLKLPLTSHVLFNIFSAYGIEGIEISEEPDKDEEEEKTLFENEGINPDEPIGDELINQKVQNIFDAAFSQSPMFDLSNAEVGEIDLGQVGGVDDTLILSDKEETESNELDLSGMDDEGLSLSDKLPGEEIDLSGSDDELILSEETQSDELDLSGMDMDDEGLSLSDELPGEEIDLSGSDDELTLSEETESNELDLSGMDDEGLSLSDELPEGEIDLSGPDDELILSEETESNELDLSGMDMDDEGLSLSDEQPEGEIDLSGPDDELILSEETQSDELDLSGMEDEGLSLSDELPGDDISFDSQSDESIEENALEALVADETQGEDFSADLNGENETSAYLQEENLEDDLPRNYPSAEDLEEPLLPERKATENLITEEEVHSQEPEREEEISFDLKEKEALKEIDEFHTQKLSSLAQTIRELREDRDALAKRLSSAESESDLTRQEELGLKAQLDEKKIELKLLKRKYEDQIDEFQYRLKLSEERRDIATEKQKLLMEEVGKLNQKVRLDLKKIQSRERELESQLELIKADADIQIKNRDRAILELKRKIDSLEFDMETMSQQEEKHLNTRVDLETKLSRVMKTLRSALTLLDEVDIKEIEALKKDLNL